MLLWLDLFQLVQLLLSEKEKKKDQNFTQEKSLTEFVFWIMRKAWSFNFIRKAVKEKETQHV